MSQTSKEFRPPPTSSVEWEDLGENPSFRAEIENPIPLGDEAWWVLNRQYEGQGTPLFVGLGINTPATSSAGRHFLSDLCQRTNRVVLTRDRKALGLSGAPSPWWLLTATHRSQARQNLLNLRRIGFPRVHVGGTSLGSVDGLMMGAHDTHHQIISLTTLSLPFQLDCPRNTRQAAMELLTRFGQEENSRRPLPPKVNGRRELYRTYLGENLRVPPKNPVTGIVRQLLRLSGDKFNLADRMDSTHVSSGKLPMHLKTLWDTTSVTPDWAIKLASHIGWINVVGFADQITPLAAHRLAVDLRRETHPEAVSELVVLPDANHSWTESTEAVVEIFEKALADAA